MTGLEVCYAILVFGGLIYELFYFMAITNKPYDIGFGLTVLAAIIAVVFILLWYWKLEKPLVDKPEIINKYRKKGTTITVVSLVCAVGFCTAMYFVSPQYREMKERREIGDEAYDLLHDDNCLYPNCSKERVYNEYYCYNHISRGGSNSGNQHNNGSSTNKKPSNNSTGTYNRYPSKNKVDRDFEHWYEDHEDEYDSYDDAFDAWEDGDY